MKLSNNFSLGEFECNDGSTTPADVLKNLQKVAKQLQILRDYTGAPIKVNSGYRSPDYNKSIGGATKSQHVLGKAADIVISGYTPDETYTLIEQLINQGVLKIGGLGKYKSFTHIDIRDNKARWDNT